MPYSALSALRIPYEVGSAVMLGTPAGGAITSLSTTQIAELNDPDQVVSIVRAGNGQMRVWFFLPSPQAWQVTNWYAHVHPTGLGTLSITLNSVEGSNDTVTGSDGTWETASLTGGVPSGISNGDTKAFDLWRTDIRAISFTQAFRVIRVTISNTSTSSSPQQNYVSFHWYGTKVVDTHDLVFLDGGTPVTAVHNFGDLRRAEDSAVKAFALRNTSLSRTASGVTVSLPTQTPADQGVTVGPSASGPWSQSIEIGTLAPGTDSSAFYVRSEPPLAQALGPRMYPLTADADAGFFEGTL